MRKLLAATFALLMMVVMVAAASGCRSPSRDVSTPSKALLGHWKNTIPGVNPDVYYSSDEVSFQRKGEEESSVPYKIESEDLQEFSLEVGYQGAGEPTKITFSKDRNTITVLPPNIPELFRYQYVDAKQKP